MDRGWMDGCRWMDGWINMDGCREDRRVDGWTEDQ